MQLLNRKKSNGTITVSILHNKPNKKKIDFLKVYRIKNNPEINVKSVMTKAFKQAHPNWHISDVTIKKEK
jgi:hypothetical protein